MLIKLTTILEISRIYSLPMTVLSWLVAFTYSLLLYGNASNGILAFFGICFLHLATNVYDDYFDYKALIKQLDFNKSEYLKNTQKTKCRYIIAGLVSEKEVFLLASLYMAIAGFLGIILYFKCGSGVLYFGAIGAVIAILYSFLSKVKLSELAVGIAYGPALYGGVYYVMTKTYSWDVFVLSIPTTIMTIILLYIHTVMDFDFDISEGKKTLANSFDSQLDSLIVLKSLLIASYLSPILLCIFDILDWQVFGVLLTIPLALDLYNSIKDFSINPQSVPTRRWFHFPMENLKAIKNIKAEAFMIRMYQSRNLMIYFSLLLTFAIVLCMI